MLRVIVGVLLVLHGLVHLFYFAQSRRVFELRPDFVWPDGSWAFTRSLGQATTRSLAAILCAVAAVLFVLGGAAVLLHQSWSVPVVVGAAAVSAALYLMMWNGRPRRIMDQGWLGIAIDVVVLVAFLATPGSLGL
jgi:hypothetical protein